MKKLYETPEMEVFNFETTDAVMNTNPCPNNQTCEFDCLTEKDCDTDDAGCILYDSNCPSDCFLDGLCIPDINISRK